MCASFETLQSVRSTGALPMIKRFIIAFILVVLVVGGLVGFNLFRDQAIEQFFANMPRPAVTVSTATVEPTTWTPGITAIGTVNAARGVDLSVEAAGIVKEIAFSANDKVEAGAVLLQLDDAVQRADLDASKTQAALDRQTLDRAVELQKRGVGSEVTVEGARAAAENSALQVAKLQAVLDQRQLRAPFGGTIGIPQIEAGQYLAPGTVVATLQDLSTLRADFVVPEQELALIKIGQPVRFGLSENDLPFTGSITGIEPRVDPTTRLVSVRAEVSNPDGTLSPGQFVQVRVELPPEDGVLAIMQTALVTSLYGDYVYVVRPAEQAAPAEGAAAPSEEAPAATESAPAPAESAPAEPAAAATPAPAADEPAPSPEAGAENAAPQAQQPALQAVQLFVQSGRRSDGRVEIREGLKAGDQIVTAGQNRLSNGAPVAVDNSVQPQVQAGATP